MTTAALVTPGNRTLRFLEVAATVAIWMTITMAFHLQRAHNLLGIPITAAFQLGVRRQPLRTLWVRNGAPFRLDAWGWMLALLIALYPGYRLFAFIHSGETITKMLSAACAVVGAIPAAYALRNFRRSMLRSLLLCLAIAGGLGILVMAIFALGGVEHYTLLQRVQAFVTGMLRYLPVGFVIEEVSFRGAFDSHLYHPGESRSVLSALFVSALWGLWHVAAIPPGPMPMPLWILAPMLVVVHCLSGVPLSIFWRRSGNLVVPASAHALVDAVRNALLGAPV